MQDFVVALIHSGRKQGPLSLFALVLVSFLALSASTTFAQTTIQSISPTSPTPTQTSTSTSGTYGTALTSCTDLTKSGSYYLANNVTSGGTCFFIDANNINLNLNGHTITYGTSGGSRPAPGVLLADPWYGGYSIARTGSTNSHGGFEIYNGFIIQSTSAPNKSPAIWVGQSNDISPMPKIHGLTLKTYTQDSSPIFGTVTPGGWQIDNNNIYYLAKSISARAEFLGDAIWIGDHEQDPTSVQDFIYGNYISAAPQGGIRDTHQHAKIYNNHISFNSTYTNDFCVDAPADYQEVYGNTCQPTSGRGIHTNANYVYIHDNTISVQELKQNAEYGGCELGGAYGIQVEFDTSFLSSPPVGVRVANNHVTAVAGDCNAIGLRMTSMSGNGSISYTTNNVTTTNQGRGGLDYDLSFSDVVETGTNFQYSGNTFSSQHAYLTVDWDGAYVTIPSGQHWYGTPLYAIDNQNGANDSSGPTFSQSVTIFDSTPGAIHCGGNAKGYNRGGSKIAWCNNVQGIAK